MLMCKRMSAIAILFFSCFIVSFTHAHDDYGNDYDDYDEEVVVHGTQGGFSGSNPIGGFSILGFSGGGSSLRGGSTSSDEHHEPTPTEEVVVTGVDLSQYGYGFNLFGGNFNFSVLLAFINSPVYLDAINAANEAIAREKEQCLVRAAAAETQCIERWSEPLGYGLICTVSAGVITGVAGLTALSLGPVGAGIVGIGVGAYTAVLCGAIHEQFNLSCKADFDLDSAAC